jgi:Uncharacterized protein conserved in bacteria (DUF2242)
MLGGLALCACLAGCGSTPLGVKTPTTPENFESGNEFARSVPANPAASCEASRRALLSQGYVISRAENVEVVGKKKFQRDADVHTEIEFHIVCAPNSKGSQSTTVFATAVRDRYALKKSSNSASVGVGAIGSLSLPFGSSDDSLVKVASETIPDKRFYAQFFDRVESYLDAPIEDDMAGKEAADSESEPSTPSARTPQ